MVEEVNRTIVDINRLSDHGRESMARVSAASGQASRRAAELNEMVGEFGS